MLATAYADTQGSIDKESITKSYQKLNKYGGDLSRNRQDANFDVVVVGSISESLKNIKAWSQTSTFLSMAFNQTDHEYGQVCKLEEVVASAQAIFNEKIEFYRSYYGYELTELNLGYASDSDVENPCKEVAAGEIVLNYIRVPQKINLDSYDVIAFHIYDNDYHSGGFQGYLQAGDGVTQGDEKVFDKTFFVSGATDFNQSQKVRYPDFDEKVLADYYTQQQVELTEFEQQTAHELIHAFGLSTHDCGLDHYSDVDFSNLESVLLGNNYANFSYGDWFSVMGASSYSVDLAPSSKEYLGWVNSNQIHTIESDQTSVEINEAYSNDGLFYAKIKVEQGWLYVSYYNGNSYGESLMHPKLSGNLEGIQIRYTESRDPEVFKTLTTSVLLDPNADLTDHDYALKPGYSFSLYGVTIDNVVITGESAVFDVRYSN
ncbi:hypothetical protein V1358_10135 [Pseudoalteromonas sp. YIC-656]|uniref:hypothetical protein n=1 Tax=Pseudoalteromonas pernae TaxID=3118054 RepID=UPI0032425F25